MADKKQTYGKLYLVPVTLGKTPTNNTIPEHVLEIARRLEVLIVENIQTARRYLQWIGDTVPDYEIEFLLLNKNTTDEEIKSFLKPLKEGKDVGLLSEAGIPVVADPGSSLVTLAHKQDIRVIPLTGPSSVFLALMASGFNGQNFAFTGYLPIDRNQRVQELKKLEKESREKDRTIIFMEAPQRNDELIDDILSHCHPDTHFCVAVNITLPDEQIKSAPIRKWRTKDHTAIGKEPAIFLLYAHDPSAVQ